MSLTHEWCVMQSSKMKCDTNFNVLKGHWTRTTSYPNFFQKVGIFMSLLEVLAWVMTAC